MAKWERDIDASVWNAANCKNWYQDHNGRPYANWSSRVWNYYSETGAVSKEDFLLYR